MGGLIMEDKIPVWTSKTLWCSLIVAVAPLFPPLQAVIVANPEITSLAVGGLFAILRLFTKKPLGVK
jgi:hypothetical protein